VTSGCENDRDLPWSSSFTSIAPVIAAVGCSASGRVDGMMTSCSVRLELLDRANGASSSGASSCGPSSSGPSSSGPSSSVSSRSAPSRLGSAVGPAPTGSPGTVSSPGSVRPKQSGKSVGIGKGVKIEDDGSVLWDNCSGSHFGGSRVLASWMYRYDG
jgi:hypothetical protein